MKIVLIADVVGDGINWPAGTVVDLPEEDALSFLVNGFATILEEPSKEVEMAIHAVNVNANKSVKR